MEELEITGLWWLPKEPNNKVGGTLTFTPEEGPVLKLIGTLGGVKAVQAQTEIGIIHGFGKKAVTLEATYTRSISLPLPGVQNHKLGAKRVFIGVHLNDADLKFNRINIGLEYLPEFVNHSSLMSSTHSDKAGNWLGVKAEVATQKSIRIGPVPNGYASIRFGWGTSQERFRSLTLKEKSTLTVELNESIELENIFSGYIKPVQDLVTMATDEPNAITKLSVHNPEMIDPHTSKPLNIEVYQRGNTAAQTSRKALIRPDMLFTLSDLKQSKLNKWILASERFKPAVGILFGQRYSKGIHIENKLLNAVSAVEAYHRRRFTNTVLDKTRWKAKKNRIISKVDKPDIHFLNEALQHANEKRLKARLKEVLKHSGISSDLVPDATEWNKQIREHRNVLTHYDPSSTKEIKDYEPVYWLAESLVWIMLACFMVEAGFSRKEVSRLVKENQRYIFVKERVSEILKK